MKQDCKFCEKGDELSKKFLHIKRLKGSDVYLFRNQYLPGRCALMLSEHYKEIYDIPENLRNQFFEDMNMVVQALEKYFHADKINIAAFGDESPHFHFHLVPKYKGSPRWGKPYCEAPMGEKYITDEELNNIIDDLRKLLDNTGDCDV